jgi:hypothetical protein
LFLTILVFLTSALLLDMLLLCCLLVVNLCRRWESDCWKKRWQCWEATEEGWMMMTMGSCLSMAKAMEEEVEEEGCLEGMAVAVAGVEVVGTRRWLVHWLAMRAAKGRAKMRAVAMALAMSKIVMMKSWVWTLSSKGEGEGMAGAEEAIPEHGLTRDLTPRRQMSSLMWMTRTKKTRTKTWTMVETKTTLALRGNSKGEGGDRREAAEGRGAEGSLL